ncbi:hypothetical protein CBR_g40064 [Chara braunii]|uniref:BTB domain-containing protein n=1 Tax=Chara braunii TaxID=69332 RepID=A0A388LT85_CHABU|nr:hypothetical protein CBR_g40064 [Chara braunii]|eukprot:GBG85422.1 hypothetical protein CBR_g40064 [Chara braunii]
MKTIDCGVILWPSLSQSDEEREDTRHRQRFMAAVGRIIDRSEMLDVTFVCKDLREVRANRTLTASGSEYFFKLLYGNMKERFTDRIALPDVWAGSLQVVVDYLHGCPFRWNDDSCWESMVDTYLLAERCGVSGLCQRILLLVARFGYARELGDLLNAAVVQQAQDVLRAAVKALNNVVVFDSSSFVGWAKESIKFCLENVQFHPSVTEMVLAEAVLSAAAPSAVHNVEEDECRSSLPADDSTDKIVNNLHEDVREILTSHINLVFVKPTFITTRIEGLKILPPDLLAAIYRAQALYLSRGTQLSGSLFTMPWRSLLLELPLVPLKTDEHKVRNFYLEFPIPSVWSSDTKAKNFAAFEDAPQRVRCVCNGPGPNPIQPQVVRMRMRLPPGKHVWRVHMVKQCECFAVGIAAAGDKLAGDYHWMISSLCDPTVLRPWNIRPNFVKDAGFEKFHRAGSSVIVIFDNDMKVLTFANDWESYVSYKGEYPIAFSNLPQSSALYPALLMSNPACGDIEWIESSPRPGFVRR